MWSRRKENEQEESLDSPEIRVRAGPQGGRGMSEVLSEVAEPILTDLRLSEHEEAFEVGLNIAAAIWNASLLDSPRERRKALAEVKKNLRPPGSRHQLEMIIDRTYHRARRLHPDETRPIVAVDLALGSAGRYRINVASASFGE